MPFLKGFTRPQSETRVTQRLRVTYRPSARADLAFIFNAVKRGSGLANARNYSNRIKERCDKIGELPQAGRRRDDLEPGLRMSAFERRVVILYKVEQERVSIVNIFYGGRDYEALFGADSIDD
jgi:toxin ParE1/3/4